MVWYGMVYFALSHQFIIHAHLIPLPYPCPFIQHFHVVVQAVVDGSQNATATDVENREENPQREIFILDVDGDNLERNGDAEDTITHPNDNAEREKHEGNNDIWGEFWMPAPVQLDAHEHGEDVHVGDVELEVDVSGAQVIAGGHHSDHDQSQAHGVVQVVTHASPIEDTWTFHSISMSFESFLVFSLRSVHNAEEEEAEDDVTDVAEEMIPRTEAWDRFHAKEVVVAVVEVAGSPKL